MATNNVTIPESAKSKGTLNDGIPQEQRAPDGAPLSSGPKRGPKDEYLPASYRTSKSNLIRTDR